MLDGYEDVEGVVYNQVLFYVSEIIKSELISRNYEEDTLALIKLENLLLENPREPYNYRYKYLSIVEKT